MKSMRNGKMKIKESTKELIEGVDYPRGAIYTPSTIEPYVTHHEKAWQREMRHRLMALEQRLDEIEELIKDLHPKELGV